MYIQKLDLFFSLSYFSYSVCMDGCTHTMDMYIYLYTSLCGSFSISKMCMCVCIKIVFIFIDTKYKCITYYQIGKSYKNIFY